VVCAKVALGLGKTTKKASTTFHDMWIRLGFGQLTGIDLAGEVSARHTSVTRHQAVAPDRPRQRPSAGVAVTPMQLAPPTRRWSTAGSSSSSRRQGASATQVVPYTAGETVLSKKLSKQLTRLMDHVVTKSRSTATGR
jgi:cell division protein FtsI/penicillin-binding protein 2